MIFEKGVYWEMIAVSSQVVAGLEGAFGSSLVPPLVLDQEGRVEDLCVAEGEFTGIAQVLVQKDLVEKDPSLAVHRGPCALVRHVQGVCKA